MEQAVCWNLKGLKTYATGSLASKLGIVLISDVFVLVLNLKWVLVRMWFTCLILIINEVSFDLSIVGYEAPKLRKVTIDKALLRLVNPAPARGVHSEKGFEDAKTVIAALKSRGIYAVGAAGFCWSAKVVVQLAKSDYIQAAVMLHPSFVKLDDMIDVQVPIAILGAEVDKFSPLELLKQFYPPNLR
ncbi:hypothetical protein F0562_019867 [Nyssa sinensis]|uniref:Dienelactone hydrolase domain-containing protein n=1 Tax=Nyssa sinensis TaxID=561372 RepID=A0A5J5BPK5_9ASTE|nr:hypothetical protein F0562_019867 [Nyssa sinensis]